MFQNLGIARVRVKEIKESLSTRENLKIDPFNQGFDLKTTAKNISLHQIRLCFQVGKNNLTIALITLHFVYSLKKLCLFTSLYLYIGLLGYKRDRFQSAKAGRVKNC